MKRTLLTAAFAALALGAAQATTYTWNNTGASDFDQWEEKAGATMSYTFVVQTGSLADDQYLSNVSLMFAERWATGGEKDVAGITITKDGTAYVGVLTGNAGSITLNDNGTDRTVATHTFTFAGLTLEAGDTITITLDGRSGFALTNDITGVTWANGTNNALVGKWAPVMELEGDIVTLPEPTALALLALGVAGVALRRRVA